MKGREYVEMGRFTSSVGLKGEMKVQLYNRDSSNFREGARIYVASGDGSRGYDVERVRDHNGTCIAKLAGIDDRDQSDGLRNRTFSMASDDMEKLPEGYHYISDLIGMKVYDVPVADSSSVSPSEELSSRTLVSCSATSPQVPWTTRPQRRFCS